MPNPLFCAIISENSLIPIKFNGTQTVGELKDVIKAKAAQTLALVDAHTLTLYKVNIDISNKETSPGVMKQISQSSIKVDRQELDPVDNLSEYWGESDLPKRKTIHILVQMPRGESSDLRAYGAVAETQLSNNLHFIICSHLHCPSNDVPMPITAPLLQFCNHRTQAKGDR